MILIILLIYFLISIYTIYSELAQLAEHLTVNQVVAGSSPAFGATKSHHFGGFFCGSFSNAGLSLSYISFYKQVPSKMS